MAGIPQARGHLTGSTDAVAPLIVTALLPKDMAAWATGLRTRYFPPERNYLDAHVTLFHAIPPSCAAELGTILKTVAAETAPVSGKLDGLMSLGRGTALKLSSPAMLSIRNRIARRFEGALSAQDQHKPRLHVTIQNKVSSTEAKAVQVELADRIEPREFAFRGLAAFWYRGGPWELVREYPFRGHASA